MSWEVSARENDVRKVSAAAPFFFPTYPPTASRKDGFERVQIGHALRLRERFSQEAASLILRGFSAIRTILLERGGWGAVLLSPEIEQPEMITSGMFLAGDGAHMYQGKVSNCHENSAKLAVERPESLAWMTGMALSDDGLWRSHSWVVRNGELTGGKPQIVETTLAREAYFGILRTPAQAKEYLAGRTYTAQDFTDRMEAALEVFGSKPQTVVFGVSRPTM